MRRIPNSKTTFGPLTTKTFVLVCVMMNWSRIIGFFCLFEVLIALNQSGCEEFIQSHHSGWVLFLFKKLEKGWQYSRILVEKIIRREKNKYGY